jgi:hypothetical protein
VSINVHTLRRKAYAQPADMDGGEKSPDEALRSLVIYELGFGGQVVDLTRTDGGDRVVVRTHVMAADDTVTFTGPSDEMNMVTSTAAYWLMFQEQRTPLVEALSDRIMAVTKGEALLVGTVGVMMVGASFARLAVLAAYGVEDLEVAKRLCGLSMEDMLAALAMSKKDNTSPAEILAALGEAMKPANVLGM